VPTDVFLRKIPGSVIKPEDYQFFSNQFKS